MNTGHLRSEGLSVPLHILFLLLGMSVPDQYAPPPLLSPPIELLLILHDPTYMTPWGKAFSGLPLAPRAPGKQYTPLCFTGLPGSCAYCIL